LVLVCPVWNIKFISEINEHQGQRPTKEKGTYLEDINIQLEYIILLILVLQGVGMYHELLTGSRAITSSKLKMVHDYNAGTTNNPEVNSVPSYRGKSHITASATPGASAAAHHSQTGLEFSSL
jgi:hypothetical protein